jgi:hypothetical protein
MRQVGLNSFGGDHVLPKSWKWKPETTYFPKVKSRGSAAGQNFGGISLGRPAAGRHIEQAQLYGQAFRSVYEEYYGLPRSEIPKIKMIL